MPVLESTCVICGTVADFEQPPCADRHGADCPERVCVRCGAADLVGIWPAEKPEKKPAKASRKRRRAA